MVWEMDLAGEEQQDSFDHIRAAICSNVITGGHPDRRYYLSFCEVATRWGGVVIRGG